MTTEKTTKKPTQAEYEKQILKLAEEGLTSEKIGENLRKQNIHSKEYKKTISQILKEKGKYIDPDLKNVEAKLNRTKAHFEKNKQDKKAMRERDRVFSQLRKLKIYNKIN
jgi:ribosomal protein S15P/S13E